MKFLKLIILLLIPLQLSCGDKNNNEMKMDQQDKSIEKFSGVEETATLAGGCFWCIEQPFESIDGVIKVVSGYSGGEIDNPTYNQVSSGETKYRESVQVTFDPEVISYAEILSVYWKQFDPTDEGGSFADRGFQYTSAIFYHNDEQKMVAENSKKVLDKSGMFDKSIVTPIIQFKNFYPAEEYHQDYYKKNPDDYKRYKKASGRVDFIEDVWGNFMSTDYEVPSNEEIKSMLTDLQYSVTQKNDTESAFDNKYYDNKKAGIYVDIVSGEPLFSSKHKFESGTGWPSFTRALDPRFVKKPLDTSLGMERVEARSRVADSHLGHIFYDGPEPGNIRYCMNSAALKFIPKDEMKEKGYGEFLWLVE